MSHDFLRGSMSISEQTYFVIPLSVQEEGQDYIVGDKETGNFYQFPAEGVAIIDFLRRGASIEEIKQRCAQRFAEPVDVDDFVSTLIDIGFVSTAQMQQVQEQRQVAASADRRWKFSMRPALARQFVSAPAVAIYGAVIAYAAVLIYRQPRLGINLGAFYLEQHLTLTLVALLVLQGMTTALHELGHMVATASRGVESRLGMGTRLWNLVAEADISGIFSLPKQQRYLPLFAGMLVDLFCIAVIVISINYLAGTHSLPLLVQILQALILQILITISWQFNMFLRTDVYYAFCIYSGYPDLDGDARLYISEKLHRLTFGLFGKPAGTAAFHNRRILRAFAAIWLVGRIASLVFLFAVILPTLGKYIQDAYQSLTGHGAGKYAAWDIAVFVLVSLAISGTGMYVWLANKIKSFRGTRHVGP